MLKTVVLFTLIAMCLALPVEESLPHPDGQQLVGPQELEPSNLGPQGDMLPPGNPEAEGKLNDDLKTDPTFWFGYRHAYPYYRRSYSYYSPSYYHSYYGYPSYYNNWNPYYYW